MSYTIDNIPLNDFGFSAGWLGSKPSSYALSGVWSVPPREGKTFHQWPTGVEPYVDADDIQFKERELSLSLFCNAANLTAFKERLNALYSAFPPLFELSHTLLGAFTVSPLKCSVKAYSSGWGVATLSLLEVNPDYSLVALPSPIGGGSGGIDGYSWGALGLVVSSLGNRYDLPPPLEVGVRAPLQITLEGTLKGSNYSDFALKVARLRSLLFSSGLRSITYFDGTTLQAFAAEGLTIDNVWNFHPVHWGRVSCKLIVV